MGAWKPPCATFSGVHAHGGLEVVVCLQVVVCISRLTCHPTITGEAKHGGSDCAPLCLSEGDSAEVKGQDVGANGHGLGLIDMVNLHDGGGIATPPTINKTNVSNCYRLHRIDAPSCIICYHF
jgi:hypothetical protein